MFVFDYGYDYASMDAQSFMFEKNGYKRLAIYVYLVVDYADTKILNLSKTIISQNTFSLIIRGQVGIGTGC